MKNILNSIKSHPQKDEILKQIRYGQSKQKHLRPLFKAFIEILDSEVEAHREIDGGFEVYKLPLPAALGVKEGINLPRYPTMKGRLASKKAELKTLEFFLIQVLDTFFNCLAL